MRNTKFFTPLRLLILAALLVSLLTSFAVGKYVQKISHTNSVTFSANLAEEFYLEESKAVRLDDGSYILYDGGEITEGGTRPSETTTANDYILIPGVDIPKDPRVVIKGKSDIAAYLFIEVVDQTPNEALVFELDGHWKTTTLKNPVETGGTVYVYQTGTEPVQITSDLTVGILKDNTVTVNQTLLSGQSNNLLQIYAYLEEVPPQNGT